MARQDHHQQQHPSCPDSPPPTGAGDVNQPHHHQQLPPPPTGMQSSLSSSWPSRQGKHQPRPASAEAQPTAASSPCPTSSPHRSSSSSSSSSSSFSSSSSSSSSAATCTSNASTKSSSSSSSSKSSSSSSNYSSSSSSTRTGILLVQAVVAGDVTEVQRLVAADAELARVLTAADNQGRTTALIEAAQRGHVQMVLYLLQQGAGINQVGEKQRTALYWAANKGQVDVVLTLLSHKADPNRADLGGRTPLLTAASQGHLQVLSALLKNNGSPSCSSSIALDAATYDSRRTALWYATHRGRTAAVRLLLEAGANPSLPDWDCLRPLDIALWRKPQGCSILLREAERSYLLFKARQVYTDAHSPPSSRPAYLTARYQKAKASTASRSSSPFLLPSLRFLAPPSFYHPSSLPCSSSLPANKRMRGPDGSSIPCSSPSSLPSSSSSSSSSWSSRTVFDKEITAQVFAHATSGLAPSSFCTLLALMGKTTHCFLPEDEVSCTDEEVEDVYYARKVLASSPPPLPGAQ